MKLVLLLLPFVLVGCTSQLPTVAEQNSQRPYSPNGGNTAEQVLTSTAEGMSTRVFIKELEFRYGSDPEGPPEAWQILGPDNMTAHLEYGLEYNKHCETDKTNCYSTFSGQAFIWRRGERELWDILESDVALNACDIEFDMPPSEFYRRTIGAREIDVGWANSWDRQWLEIREGDHFAGYAKFRFHGGIEVRFKFRTKNKCRNWQGTEKP